MQLLSVLAFGAAVTLAPFVQAQTVDPTSISIPDSDPACNDDSQTQEACITLPEGSTVDKVDVFFLFDDTGSFAGFVPTVSGIFSGLVTDLQTALPAVEFGFGVGRFEDYGGPGTGFSGEVVSGRPFVLNQPIVTAADAGGPAALDALIIAALGRTAPGFGGDGPESAIAEGLYQAATGLGFDGDGDGFTTGIGGAQPAGALLTQTAPDASGDVPSFATLDAGVIASGSVGGAGFRTGALRLVILATDVCSIAAFDSAPVPGTIVGTGSTEASVEYACSGTEGSGRFGFVSDSLTAAGNTVAGAIVPLGAGTVPDTIAALNAAGIRVLGMGPGAGPVPAGTGPTFDESAFLSALARTTGAVDEFGDPLVFDIGGGGDPLKDAIVAAITATTTLPIDITMMTDGGEPVDLLVSFDPDVVPDVAPAETACFDVTFSGVGSPNGTFDLNFKDFASGAVLGTIPVEVLCEEITEIEVAVDIKPTSCPNPINCRGGGVVPVAILGSSTFDVSQIDPETVLLEGLIPIRWAFEDVGTPHVRTTDGCDDCTTAGADGFVDLTLKYDKKELLAMVGDDLDICRVVNIVGNLLPEFGGTPIVGTDVVRFQCR